MLKLQYVRNLAEIEEHLLRNHCLVIMIFVKVYSDIFTNFLEVCVTMVCYRLRKREMGCIKPSTVKKYHNNYSLFSRWHA